MLGVFSPALKRRTYVQDLAVGLPTAEPEMRISICSVRSSETVYMPRGQGSAFLSYTLWFNLCSLL